MKYQHPRRAAHRGYGICTPSVSDQLSRREFVKSAALAAAALRGVTASAQQPDAKRPPYPIIDTHIHFFDSRRPQGVPYGSGRPPALPEVFRFVAEPLGVVGAIHVEASPWIEDNLWILNISWADTIMVGVIGNLEPDKLEFREYLDRYRRHPLFRGIRYGNLWGRDLGSALEKPEFVTGMKELAAADLTLDTANPRPKLIEDVVRLTDKVPGIRVVIDHLPGMDALDDPAQRSGVEKNLRELAQRNLFVKVSAVARRVDGEVVTDPAFYKPRLDLIWDIFGGDRLIYGSDWPNSSGNWVSYETALSLVRQYFDAKGREVAEKYFWKNSVAAYRWPKRDPGQPGQG
jgi:predicted TIM-barrel fold metal-dependent hydrolase